MKKYVLRVQSDMSTNASIKDYFEKSDVQEFNSELEAYKEALKWQRLITKYKNDNAIVYVREIEE